MNTQTFGDRIKDLRKRNKMTQEQLAEALFLENKATISSYENNRRMPAADILVEMAGVLGTTVDYLLKGEQEDMNGNINQAILIMQKLPTHLQKVALIQMKALMQIN